jgi:hypothetical protein
VSPEIPNYEQEIEKNGQRVLTFLVYLNDDYDGGETDFPGLGIAHKGRRGQGLFFVNALDDNEPDLRTVHTGRAPTKGEMDRLAIHTQSSSPRCRALEADGVSAARLSDHYRY